MLTKVLIRSRLLSAESRRNFGILDSLFSSKKESKSVNENQSTGANTTFWYDSAPTKPKTSHLSSNENFDTCVIGSGIAGLTTAYFLAQQGQKVAVVEKGEIGSGETGRTTGYLTYVIDDGLKNIINYFGKDGASLHVDSHRTAVDIVERIALQEDIQCGFTRVPSYWISRKEKSKQSGSPDKEVQEEYDLMKELGYTEASLVNKAPWAVDDGKCIRIENQGQFHSIAYLYGLADKIQAAGGKIYTGTKAQEWEGGKNSFVKSEVGNKISCKNIVWAGNVPNQLLTTIAKLEAYRSYIVAGKVPKGKYEWIMFQDDSMLHREPYNYGRFVAYDDKHDLLLVGGQDHLVGFETDFEERYQALEKWIKARYPDIDFVYRWSGQIQEPADHIAYIGLNPGNDNVYSITGDSGMGLTHGTLGGKLVSDLVLGIPNPWKDLYDPNRLKARAVPEMLKHLAEVNLQFKDYFKSGDVKNVDEIKPGCGAVIAQGISYYAVYKDEGGKVSACSAVCPHMKGLVRWNNDEKSWDCPLHGSRFDRFGTVLNGPAASNLSNANVDNIKKK